MSGSGNGMEFFDEDPTLEARDELDGAKAAEDGSYDCDACGETIVVSLDPSAGQQQAFVEDCPVCCRPNVLRVEWFEDGSVSLRSELEQ